jgi:hypothetical protein
MNYRFASLFASLAAIILVGIILTSESFEVKIPFAYASNGNSTPTNTTLLQLWTTHGATFLDGVQRQSSSPCEESFTSTTCLLLNLSGYFIGSTLVLSVFIFLLALYFSLKSNQKSGLKGIKGNSWIWGFYYSLPLLSFILLTMALIFNSVASQRLLKYEFPDASFRSLLKGMKFAAQNTVQEGIVKQWILLNHAAEVLDWQLLFISMANDQTNTTGLYNPTLATACNITQVSTILTEEHNLTNQVIGCLSNYLNNDQFKVLNESTRTLFHSISLVEAFNAALNLSLPSTVDPSSLHALVEEKAWETGNRTLMNMGNTAWMTLRNNAQLKYESAWYFLIVTLGFLIVLLIVVTNDCHQRYYYMDHHYK